MGQVIQEIKYWYVELLQDDSSVYIEAQFRGIGNWKVFADIDVLILVEKDPKLIELKFGEETR